MILVQIAGHLGGEPEVRMAPSGQKITSFTGATNIRRQNEDKTVWWRVTIFGDRFDRMIPHLKKGSYLFVTGSMNPPRTYVDKEGVTQVALEIVADSMHFLGGKNDREKAEGGSQDRERAAPASGSSYTPERATPPPAAPTGPSSFFAPRQQSMSGISAGAAPRQDFTDDDVPF